MRPELIAIAGQSNSYPRLSPVDVQNIIREIPSMSENQRQYYLQSYPELMGVWPWVAKAAGFVKGLVSASPPKITINIPKQATQQTAPVPAAPVTPVQSDIIKYLPFIGMGAMALLMLAKRK
jgi:hypothetical protein